MNCTAAKLTGCLKYVNSYTIEASFGELDPKKLPVSVFVGLWQIKSYGFRTALQMICVIRMICEPARLLLSMKTIELIAKLNYPVFMRIWPSNIMVGWQRK